MAAARLDIEAVLYWLTQPAGSCNDLSSGSTGFSREREGARNKRRCVPSGQSSIDLSGQSKITNDTNRFNVSLDNAASSRIIPQVLKDDTTLAENKVSENGFMVIMVTKVALLLRDCIGAYKLPHTLTN